MRFRPATPSEVKHAETRIDSAFKSLFLPSPLRESSLWHTITVSEDRLRIILWHATHQGRSENLIVTYVKFISEVDKSKFALRYVLDRVLKEQAEHLALQPNPEVDPQSYLRAGKLLDVATDYFLASTAFSSYYAGQSFAQIANTKPLLHLRPNDNVRYSALHLLSLQEKGFDSPPAALFRIFSEESEFSNICFELETRCKSKEEHVYYIFNAFLCNQLFHMLPKPPSIVPKGWMFPWGTAEESERVFQGLQARVLYHLISIQLGSRKCSVEGAGVHDLCCYFAPDELVDNVSEITGVNAERVKAILQSITYGHNSQTPDPALQPIIPFSKAWVTTPPILILSSNYPRNLLSLHARIDAPSFDKQSERFEQEMIARIKQKVLTKFSLGRFNVFLPQRKIVGEIDMLLVDALNRTIMIGELRWILTPGDPREINNRKKVCAEKVEQIHRKTEAAREVILEILELFGLEVQNIKQTDWKVVGVVIVDGYVTASARPQEYPLIPIEIFYLAIEQLSSLALIHGWLSSNYWLPRKGNHYVSEDINLKFAGQDLRCSGLRIFYENSYMQQYLHESLSEFEDNSAVIR